MEAKQVGILTLEQDIHGILVKAALERHSDLRCHLIATDRICDANPVSWSDWNESEDFSSTIVSTEGARLKPKDLHLIWWRRSYARQAVPADVVDADHIALIRNDCHASLVGLLRNEFQGKWINDLDASRWAENKLVQLRAARLAGFLVPRTLVSNDPTMIRQFCKSLDYRVIVKTVSGAEDRFFFTRKLTDEHLASDGNLRLSPAIYQELICGHVHLRVHCFGAKVYAIQIESQDLDWRENLHVPFTYVELGADIEQKFRRVLQLLGLRMGVVDLKLNEAGIPVWLEINPQGQFLFSEALSRFNLTKQLAAFFADEVSQI